MTKNNINSCSAFLLYYCVLVSCNVLSPKTCVPNETKDINVKAFNMTANKNEAKAMT